MALSAGMCLGPYEILQPLGAGGMGEVYRARDKRLGRDVAIKVLPSHLSENEERRQRFEREARTISQLSHPHICALFDVGRQDRTDFLVMEYIDGETLSERLAKGALPTEQVLRFGIQIADALDRAHQQGIVHRDLKPGNIMLTKSGVKLLDFGLAKFMAVPSAIGLSALPTEGARPLTDTGQILGTLQYMSPEQLEGHEADARSDIFALGTVLYEMATGQKAFTGKSQASLIAAILQTEPQPISAVSPVTPPAFDRVVRVCLGKDPEGRWQRAHDVKLQLQWIADGGSQTGISAPAAGRRRGGKQLAWTAAAVLVLAAALLGMAYWRSRPATGPPLRLSAPPPEGTAFSSTGEDGFTYPAPPAISPDGTRLVFGAGKPEKPEEALLYSRRLDSFEAQPVEGTELASYPFWSPDGAWIAFFQNGKLKKMSSAGGPPETVADAPNPRGGSWGRDGKIVFAPRGGGAIFAVSEKGGTATPVTFPGAPATALSHRFPSFLPDGRHFLYLARKGEVAEKVPEDDFGVFVGSTDSRQTIRLLPDSTNAVYASPGFVLFARAGALMALSFDAGSLRAKGAATRVADKILIASYRGFGTFSASENGILAYAPASSAPLSRLAWLDRSGKPTGTPEIRPAVIWEVRLSPDAAHAALRILDPRTGASDLWSYELSRGTRTRLTSDQSNASDAVWSPESRRIAFSSVDLGIVDPTGEKGPELLTTSTDKLKFAQDWSSDGRWILFVQRTRIATQAQAELWVWSVNEKKASPYLQAETVAEGAVFSPDGRWVAYTSKEPGQAEVFVRPFPGPGSRSQVSKGGGQTPRWSRDGREIVYEHEGKLMVIGVKSQKGLEAGEPRVLITLPANTNVWDITGDHQRILAVAPVSAERASVPLRIVTNWSAGLSR